MASNSCCFCSFYMQGHGFKTEPQRPLGAAWLPLQRSLTLTSPSSDGLSDSRGEATSLPWSSLRILFSFFTRGFLFFALTFWEEQRVRRTVCSLQHWAYRGRAPSGEQKSQFSEITGSLPPPQFWTRLCYLALFSAAWGDTRLSPAAAWPAASCSDHLGESAQRREKVEKKLLSEPNRPVQPQTKLAARLL